ncbi:MAG: NFYB/HAP3 family transcription factor subunit [Candidatus ainarchaeum sp.]|nr:NFYB/HAP3 family transcription factor subunit [Candidatus ainarchaeum sp.]
MSELPLAAIERIIRKGSGLRVSDDAAKELAQYLEDDGVRISQQAALFSKHAGRKTVNIDDIKLVLKNK